MLDSGCREWTGVVNRDGYGVIHNHRDGLAHRMVWKNAHGPIPAGMLVMHLCDNPRCLSLGHLKLGTQVENQADKVAKNRQAKGAKAGAVITPEAVSDIRLNYKPRSKDAKTRSQYFADKYGVTPWTVRFVYTRRNFKYLP